MKKKINLKIILGILFLFTSSFLVFNSFNLDELTSESVEVFNPVENHLKLSDDVPGSHFHRETPTGYEAFPTSPSISTLILGGGTLQDAVKNNDFSAAGARNDGTGYFGLRIYGYSDFETIMHDDIEYIMITYRIIFTYNFDVDASDLVFTIYCDNGTSDSITLFDFAYDYVEFESTLIINETNFSEVFHRVKDGGYIESFTLSATTYSVQQFIYVDYFDIYYYYPPITTHDPIVITNDGEFTPANGVRNGTGTYNDPFIIGNLSINAGWSGSCISISGTTAYFKIENCILINSGNSSGDAGIRIFNSRNGTILNNEIFNNSEGIYMISCYSMDISNNKVYNNSNGIYVKSTENTTISNNICFNHITTTFQTAIEVRDSYNLTVTNNECFNNYIGIGGYYVYDSSFDGNNCSNNEYWGIIISNCEGLLIIDNYCVLNGQTNIQLQYSENCKTINNICKYGNSGIYISGSYNLEFSDNDCINSYSGIYIVSSESCRFYQNNLSLSGYSGFTFSSSNNNELYNNFISNNSKAIHFSGSTENYIYENWIWNNVNNFDGSIDGNYIYNNYFFSFEEHDTDGDGLSDVEELIIGTNPSLVDTDGDNYLDGYEDEHGSNPLDPNDYPIIWNTNFDILRLYLEGNWTLLQKVIQWSEGNATLLDTLRALVDMLGISIGDTDYDGLDNLDELYYGTNPAMIDTDLDNLNDAFEIKYGTDPLDDDSDDDGHYDGIELASGNDPLDPNDYPGMVPPNGGVNIPLLVGIVTTISIGLILGIFFYFKKRKIA